jgi:hypothetical protein
MPSFCLTKPEIITNLSYTGYNHLFVKSQQNHSVFPFYLSSISTEIACFLSKIAQKSAIC